MAAQPQHPSIHKKGKAMSRLIRIVLAVITGIVVGVGIAAAASTTSHATAKHHSFAPSLKQHLAVFTRAHAATAKPLPANVATSFNDPSQASVNYNPDAQAAVYEQPDPSSSFGFWVVPAEGGACVIWQTTNVVPMAQANCLKLAAVEKNGMTAISSANGATLIFGFRPNGATKVTVTNTDGSTATGAVTGNAFAVIDQKSSVQSITVQSGTGAAATTTARPLHNDQ